MWKNSIYSTDSVQGSKIPQESTHTQQMRFKLELLIHFSSAIVTYRFCKRVNFQ